MGNHFWFYCIITVEWQKEPHTYFWFKFCSLLLDHSATLSSVKYKWDHNHSPFRFAPHFTNMGIFQLKCCCRHWKMPHPLVLSIWQRIIKLKIFLSTYYVLSHCSRQEMILTWTKKMSLFFKVLNRISNITDNKYLLVDWIIWGSETKYLCFSGLKPFFQWFNMSYHPFYWPLDSIVQRDLCPFNIKP